MNAPTYPHIAEASTDRPLPPEYGWTADGDFAARIDEDGFAMIPVRAGGFSVCRAWSLPEPIGCWRRSAFGEREGPIANAEAFRDRIEEIALDRRQRAGLVRRDVDAGVFTPWGLSEHATAYGPEIVFHETASHGGFQLSAERNAMVHPMLRSKDHWYEEDREWAGVAQAFSLFFTDLERRDADKIIRNWFPDAWEDIHGRALLPGQSRERDRRAFESAHADSWIVLTAIASKHQPDHVECIATPGGYRGAAERRRYLVPADDYLPGRFGFVIDEERHHPYGGPTSFLGGTW